MAETPKKKNLIYRWTKMENIKLCPNCGKGAIAQNPAEQSENIITCGACGVRFKILIISI